MRTRSSRCCFSANLTAKPLSNLRITRPTQAPTASGVPTGGSYSLEIATPAVETSMMKQGWVLPSATVRKVCEACGTKRASFRSSRTLVSF